MLRKYQQKAIDDLYEWFRANKYGNPCIVLPTGSGKSHVVAAICKDAISQWPETRVLMATHVKELIEQNAEKMLLHWPDAPLGIYSAGIGRKESHEQITFAGIQSIRKKAGDLGRIDLMIVDEAHLISHNTNTSYRKLIDGLKIINPAMRIIGLTATPYRLGQGMLTDKGGIFTSLIEPTSIEALVEDKYLAPLKSKLTGVQLNVSGVHKRGGEYIEKELQAAVNKDHTNNEAVDEVIKLAGDRKAWLFFCAGVKHAMAIKDILLDRGIEAECITGETPKPEREKIISEFKSGKIRALTNANVLTTGFDYPDMDLIVMLRPTMSPGLYVQMAGRGMRIKSHTDHCMVLDFAGVVQTHGPITNVKSPNKPGNGTGEAPVKVCPECDSLLPPAVKTCPDCGYEFPPPKEKRMRLHDVDIMGRKSRMMPIGTWHWSKHVSKASGKEMIKVRYYSKQIMDPIVSEYFAIMHEGYAGEKSRQKIIEIAHKSKINASSIFSMADDLDQLCSILNTGRCPNEISYAQEGKFYKVTKREWAN
jgi:DNA repair protein RadD